MTIRLFRPTRTGFWYFQILKANGEVLATSSGYKVRDECLKDMREMKWRMIFAKIVEDDL